MHSERERYHPDTHSMLVGRKHNKVLKSLPFLVIVVFVMFPNLFTFSSVGAEIKRARPDLLKDIEIGREDGIPPDMPSDFLEKHDKKYHVEGIGEPITACFLTGMKVDPTKWYPYTSPHSSPSHNPHLILVLSASLGGYLKNMMGYVRFGIL